MSGFYSQDAGYLIWNAAWAKWLLKKIVIIKIIIRTPWGCSPGQEPCLDLHRGANAGKELVFPHGEWLFPPSSSRYLISGHWEEGFNVIREPGPHQGRPPPTERRKNQPQIQLSLSLIFCVRLLPSPAHIAEVCTSGSVPWKYLPFSLLPSPQGQLSSFLPRRMTRGQQDLARECPHSVLPRPDLQVEFWSDYVSCGRPACSSETLQS